MFAVSLDTDHVAGADPELARGLIVREGDVVDPVELGVQVCPDPVVDEVGAPSAGLIGRPIGVLGTVTAVVVTRPVDGRGQPLYQVVPQIREHFFKTGEIRRFHTRKYTTSFRPPRLPRADARDVHAGRDRQSPGREDGTADSLNDTRGDQRQGLAESPGRRTHHAGEHAHTRYDTRPPKGGSRARRTPSEVRYRGQAKRGNPSTSMPMEVAAKWK